jgi:hypothetical protein
MSLAFYFNSSTVDGLTRLILGALIMVMLLREKALAARLLGIAFASVTVFNILLLVTDGMLPPLTDYLNPQETVPLVWAMVGLVPFSYYFPELVFTCEMRWVRGFFIGYAIFATLLAFVQAYAAAIGRRPARPRRASLHPDRRPTRTRRRSTRLGGRGIR